MTLSRGMLLMLFATQVLLVTQTGSRNEIPAELRTEITSVAEWEVLEADISELMLPYIAEVEALTLPITRESAGSVGTFITYRLIFHYLASNAETLSVKLHSIEARLKSKTATDAVQKWQEHIQLSIKTFTECASQASHSEQNEHAIAGVRSAGVISIAVQLDALRKHTVDLGPEKQLVLSQARKIVDALK